MVSLQTSARDAQKLPLIREPDLDNPDWVAIAKTLSQLGCFGGKTHKFYSEAERAVRLAALMPQYKLYGLVHNAPRAFLHPEYFEAPWGISNVRAVTEALYESLGLIPPNRHPAKYLLRWADDLLRVSEHKDIVVGRTQGWRRELDHGVPLYFRIEPWSAEQAEWRLLFDLEQALRYGGLAVPDNVTDYLAASPYRESDALPLSRGEIRGFGPRDEVNEYVEAQIAHHAYKLFGDPPDLTPRY